MDIDVLLCDHAEAMNGKLFISGAAINIFWTPPQPPHGINAALAMVVHVPYTATNQPHHFAFTLVDDDGNEASSWSPEGQDAGPVKIEGDFNVGRPPNLSPGESQTMPIAVKFQVLLANLGRYSFRVDLDGSEVRRIPFKVEHMS